MSIFESAPEFIEQDARQRRAYNPITLLSLTSKCEALLPKHLVEGKSVLDLGSCLGAMGHWALSHGARFYHGIEIQGNFFAKSKKFLERWGNKALIEQDDIKSALNRISQKSFDIVVAAGILQTFMDPQVILQLMCHAASQYLAIEATTPPLVRSGKITEDLPIMEFTHAACNADFHDGQFIGSTAILSLAATEWICKQNGFIREQINLCPIMHKDTIAYSVNQNNDLMPFRYFCRFHYWGNTEKPSLEHTIKTKNQRFYQDWQEAPLNIKAKQQKLDEKSTWKFDETVAKNFVEMANQHIPQYSKTIDACIEIIEKHKPYDAKIIDVGCATGETLRRLQLRGFTNLCGVDNSEAMLKECQIPEIKCIHSALFPEEEGPFDVIIANWTLHFVTDRENYIQSIANALSKNGLFFISEKTTMSDLMKDYYYDFKRAQGLNEAEIKQKEESLQGVLYSYPLGWYYNVLYQYGFKSVDILMAERGFVTLCCQYESSKLVTR